MHSAFETERAPFESIVNRLTTVVEDVIKRTTKNSPQSYFSKVESITTAAKEYDNEKDAFRTLRLTPMTSLFEYDKFIESTLFAAAQLINEINSNQANTPCNGTTREVENLGTLLIKLAWCVGNLEHSEHLRASFDLNSRRREKSSALGTTSAEKNKHLRIVVCNAIVSEYPRNSLSLKQVAERAMENRRIETVHNETARKLGVKSDFYELTKKLKRWSTQNGTKEILEGFFLDEGDRTDRSSKA